MSKSSITISYYFLLFPFLALIGVQGLAQVTVNYDNASNLVNNVLLGNGVVATNITYNGDALQLGYFDATGTALGISSGVIMSTDDIEELDPNTGIGLPINNNSFDQDLLDIANSVPPLIGQFFSVSDVNDVATLEFDFTAISDSIEFNFVFASEEYQNYENTQYNDVFAFFISGPGINGPYASPAGFPNGAQNIAVVPGAVPPLPITISSVNAVVNSSFYVNNNDPNIGTVNGFTIPITAVAEVQCGQTYHIKLAIADGTDSGWNSTILLEEGSFSANTGLEIEALPSFTAPDLGENQVYEGCGSIEVVLTRDNVVDADTLLFSVSGTAIEGLDYVNFPDTAIFPAGQSQVTISVETLFDLVPETNETIIFAIAGDCVDTIGTDTLYIIEAPQVSLAAINDTAGCPADFTDVGVEVLTGVPGFNYEWSTGVINSSLNDTDYVTLANNQGSQSVYVTVTDGCGLYYDVQQVTLYAFNPVVNLFMPDVRVCRNSGFLVSPVIYGGVPPYTYWWESASGASGVGDVIDVDLGDTYTLYASDACPSDTGSSTFEVEVYAPIVINPIDDRYHICPNISFLESPTFSGGLGSYFYTWDSWQSFIVDSVLSDTPEVTTTYELEAVDKCFKDTVSLSFTVTVDPYTEMELLSVDSLIGCYGDYMPIDLTVNNGVADFDYAWTYAPVNTNLINVLLREDDVVEVLVTDECGYQARKEIVVDVRQPEVSISADYFDIDEVDFFSEASEDVIEYAWDFGDRSVSDQANPFYSYADPGTYLVELLVYNPLGCYDSAYMYVQSPNLLFIPSAFSPTVDNINPVWQPIHNGLVDYRLRIFNRWGGLVFETNDPEDSWDGTNQKGVELGAGIFAYRIEARSAINNEKIERRGAITLIR